MSNQAEALFQQGKSHFEQKKWNEAEQSFREAIKRDEGNANYHAWLARTLSAMEKDTLALEEVNVALKLNPQCAMAYFVCGRVHGEKKEWDKAIQNYTYAIEFDSQLVIAYINRGNVFSNKKEWDKAIQDFTRAIELDPKNAYAYNNRSWVFYNKKEWDNAIQDYTRAIELDPKDADAYNNRGYAFTQKQESDKAIQDYTRAIELNPQFALAYYNRGHVFRDKQEWDKAIQDNARAIELNPEAKYPKYADRWLDWPERGWLAETPDITHIVVIILGLIFYCLPGIILIIVMSNGRSLYRKNKALVEENHDFAFSYTGCHWLGSVFHLGGHPALPFKQRVVLGIRSDSVRFYDYNLRLLHSVPLNEVQVGAETRHVTTSSFGTVYQPTNSSFGTTSSTQHIDMKPDTLRMALLVKGERVIAEFDMRPIDPLNFVDTFNKAKLG